MSAGVGFEPLLRTELRLHRRHGVLLATAAMTVMWSVVLVALPGPWRAGAVPWVLFIDLATLGFFLVPALAVVERGNGVTAALALTRLRPWKALVTRLSVLTVAALAAGTVLLLVGRPGSPAVRLLGVLLTTVLVAVVAVVMVGRADTLTTYLARAPFVAIPLLVPPLLRGTGLWDHPVLAVSPMTGAFELLSGRWALGSAAWLVLAVAVLGAAAVRIGFDVRPGPAPGAGSGRRSTRPIRASGWRGAARSHARVDRRTLLGDGMLVMLLAGIPLIALAVRWFAGAGAAWLGQRYGVDVRPHLPAAQAFVLVLHIPVMVGAITGLLFLEDRDAGLLPAVAATRSSLGTLVAYRLGVTATVAGAATALCLPLAGAQHPAGVVGVLATAAAGGAVAIVPALLLATLARDRVHGMALMKAMGVPLYLPVAWWFVDGPVGWAFVLLPTGWAVRAFWAPSSLAAATFAAASLLYAAGTTAVLLPRLRRSVSV